jgi:oxygen-dependent protoporphyrinogen oxidase
MLAAELRPITYASAAVVNLAYPTSAFPSLPIAFGFVVPAIEQRKVIAGSFSSLKFTGRAPARTTLIRLFLGGALHAHMMDLDDSAMLAAAREELRTLLDVSAEPEFAHVRRWPNSMPQYGVGHLHRVQSIHKRAAGIPNLFLAGAYLDGVGIPDCVRHGESAAEAAFAAVTQRIISQ